MVFTQECQNISSYMREWVLGLLCVATFTAFCIFMLKLKRAKVPVSCKDYAIVGLSIIQCLMSFIYFGFYEEPKIIITVRILKITQFIGICWMFLYGTADLQQIRKMNIGFISMGSCFILTFLVILVVWHPNEKFCRDKVWIGLSGIWLFQSLAIIIVTLVNIARTGQLKFKIFRANSTSRKIKVHAGTYYESTKIKRRSRKSVASDRKNSSQDKSYIHSTSTQDIATIIEDNETSEDIEACTSDSVSVESYSSQPKSLTHSGLYKKLPQDAVSQEYDYVLNSQAISVNHSYFKLILVETLSALVGMSENVVTMSNATTSTTIQSIFKFSLPQTFLIKNIHFLLCVQTTVVWDLILLSFIKSHPKTTCEGFITKIPAIEVVAYLGSNIISSVLPHWAIWFAFRREQIRAGYRTFRSNWDVDLRGLDISIPAVKRNINDSFQPISTQISHIVHSK